MAVCLLAPGLSPARAWTVAEVETLIYQVAVVPGVEVFCSRAAPGIASLGISCWTRALPQSRERVPLTLPVHGAVVVLERSVFKRPLAAAMAPAGMLTCRVVVAHQLRMVGCCRSLRLDRGACLLSRAQIKTLA